MHLASLVIAILATTTSATPARAPGADAPLRPAPALADTGWAPATPAPQSILATPSPDPGIGLGIDMHSLGNQLTAGGQALFPLGHLFGVVVRPMITGGAGPADRDLGGRVEMQVRSRIYAGMLRVYLGVGPQAFYEVRGTEAHHTDVSGGWDAGLEAFLGPRFAAHWEVGTSGGGVTGGAGPAFAVGFRVYPGRRRPPLRSSGPRGGA